MRKSILFTLTSLASVLLLFGLAGCGEADSTTSNASTNAAVYVGTWASACVPTGSSPVGSYKSVFTYNATVTSLVGNSIFFSDASCATELARAIVPATVTVGILNTDGGNNLDTVNGSTTITPPSSSVAAGFNSLVLCGKNDWVTGVTKDVSGLTCSFGAGYSATYLTSGSVRYAISKVDKTTTPNILYLSNSAATTATRPTAYSAVTFTKQ